MKYAMFVCGPSGVGKSSNIDEMLKHAGIKHDFLLIDPDKLEGTHSEQSDSAIQKVHESIQSEKSFIFQGTCGGIRLMKEFLSESKKHKFKTIVAIVYTSLPTAIQRISERKEQLVPQEVIEDLHSFFKTKAERYMKLENIDEIYLYNNEKQFSLLLSKKHKRIICRDKHDFYFDISKYC